jgi:iron(III) transport system ATP-binding protein
MLWAAYGVNRPEGGRTAPSALDAQEVDVFVALPEGAYRYEALSVADTVAVMLDGRIAQVGSPEAVYLRPVTAAVAQFLGEALVLSGQAEGGSVRCALGELPLAPAARGAVQVLVRPEQVVVRPLPGGADLRGGAPTARVTDVSFHGHDALVGRVLPQGDAVQSRVPGGWVPRPGDQVGVQVRGEAWLLRG